MSVLFKHPNESTGTEGLTYSALVSEALAALQAQEKKRTERAEREANREKRRKEREAGKSLL